MTENALPSREQALALLHEWIQNPNLLKHCLAVEAAMRHYARERGEDEARWAIAGAAPGASFAAPPRPPGPHRRGPVVAGRGQDHLFSKNSLFFAM